MKNTPATHFDLLESAAAAAKLALDKKPIEIAEIKLKGFTDAGHDREDFSDWEHFFNDRLQVFSMLRNKPTRASAAVTAVKKAAALILAVILLAFGSQAPAGIVQLTGSGPTIAANTVSNFPVWVPIGTFNLSPQYLFLSSQYNITNGMFLAGGKLSLDQTNGFNIPSLFSVTNTAPLNNALFSVTNTTFTLYAQMWVSNGMAVPLTNLQAALQF